MEEFFILIKDSAQHEIDEFDRSTRRQIYKAIRSLKFDPEHKGKPLGSFNSGMHFYEKRIFSGGGIRIYYSVDDEKVVIVEIQYLGKTTIHKVGHKKNQRKDIANLKREN